MRGLVSCKQLAVVGDDHATFAHASVFSNSWTTGTLSLMDACQVGPTMTVKTHLQVGSEQLCNHPYPAGSPMPVAGLSMTTGQHGFWYGRSTTPLDFNLEGYRVSSPFPSFGRKLIAFLRIPYPGWVLLSISLQLPLGVGH